MTLPSNALGHYLDPLPIRSRGSFQLVSARRESDGRPCVLVLPGSSADPALAREAMAEMKRVHDLLDHPGIARVAALWDVEGRPCLELDCPAVIDGMDGLRLIAEGEQKLPYGAADAFIRQLRMAIQVAHATIDPLTGSPLFLSRISLQNLLFDPSGRFVLLGFGRNLPLEKENGTLDGETIFFQAAEVATGSACTPMSDYVALLLFMRSLLPYVQPLDPLGRILRGDMSLVDAELFKLLTWIELRVFAAPAALRASMDEAIAAADRVRELLGIVPDLDAFHAFMSSLIASSEAPSGMDEHDTLPAADPMTLWLGPSLDWIARPNGERFRLGRASRLIVQELVARRRKEGSPALTAQELLEVGWPGERPIAQAGANRVYVELNRLRRMGLRDLLVKTTEGYCLSPETIVRDAPVPLFSRVFAGRRAG
jgi:hypothetical protein